MFCSFYIYFFVYIFIFVMISVRPIISTSTGPIFHEICRIGRPLTVDERCEVIFFSIPRGTLPWQPILWAKSTSFHDLVVGMTFARAAP